VVRDRNQAAHALSKIGSSRAQIPQGVFVQDIHTPSVGTDLVDKPPDEAMLIDDTTPTTSSHDWRTPFIKYLSDGSGFQDKTENERLIRRSKNYILDDGKLMRKNASSEVLLECISQDDGVKLLWQPRRVLWQPRRFQNTGREGFSRRFLLANRIRRC